MVLLLHACLARDAVRFSPGRRAPDVHYEPPSGPAIRRILARSILCDSNDIGAGAFIYKLTLLPPSTAMIWPVT